MTAAMDMAGESITAPGEGWTASTRLSVPFNLSGPGMANNPSYNVRKLITRLRELGVSLPDDAMVIRVRAGRWQRADGAWSWFFAHNAHIGSQWPVHELIKAKKLSLYYQDIIGHIHVMIEDDNVQDV